MPCLNCQHYFEIKPPSDGDAGGGQCRRHAPAVGFIPLPVPDIRTGGLSVRPERCSAFPTVASDVWCGEYQEKP